MTLTNYIDILPGKTIIRYIIGPTGLCGIFMFPKFPIFETKYVYKYIYLDN